MAGGVSSEIIESSYYSTKVGVEPSRKQKEQKEPRGPKYESITLRNLGAFGHLGHLQKNLRFTEVFWV